MSNWAYVGGGLTGVAPGSPTQIGPGGLGTMAVQTRDSLDGRRMGLNKIPDAEYPDGYLGTIQSRREDRLLDNLKTRQNDRPQQRGVHKGEKIPQKDYFWPADWQPDINLRREAQGLRSAPPLMTPVEELQAFSNRLPSGARNAVPPFTPIIPITPGRRSTLAALLPNWR